MASSSSSSSLPVRIPQTEHDVFVSFRGEDTRYNFTSHLVAALRRKQIKTFIDYQLIKGNGVSPSLVTAIEGSDISVVVFSEQYANSRWCLDELVKILECKNKYGQIVMPVFYHVDPSHVSNQTGTFGKSFSKLGEQFQNKVDKLESWRIALRETANLSGFHVQAYRPESDFIEDIVNNVLKRLNNKCGSHDIDHLIGVESIIMKLESVLSTASTSIYTLGIWGIGGIGKTTTANAIFKRISSHFEGSCLIENVREKEEKIGLDLLKHQLFSTLLEGENEKIDVNKGFSFKRLKRKKVVIVFDDVTHFEQIERLIGSLHSLGDGSRVIITTRDRQVLNKVDGIYEMKGLLHNDALTLFNLYSFEQINPNVGFEDLSKEIIKYAHGVPLALKILGRFLFGRKKEEWKSAIKKLKKIPHKDIQKVLRISYDGLDDHEQNIFLDIVCFYKGWNKDYTIELLDACGFSTEIIIKVLEEKCLLIISKNMITMHDLMEEMGKEIVRQESIGEPGKRSRLWGHEDIYKVLTYNTGTEAIRGISFNMSKVKEIRLKLCIFKKMHKLKFLKFYGENKCKLSHFRGPVFFEVRHLHWDGYPLKSLPLHFHPEYLLSLELCDSKIKKLWNGNQNLGNLKHINLSFSKQLRKLPDLKNAPNLENLILKGCSSLVEIDLSVQLNKLVIMDLRNCESLKSLPSKIHSKSLKYLLLSGCTNLVRFPDISLCNIKALNLNRIAIEELPSSIACLSRLVRLNISKCSRLKQLPRSMYKLKSLVELCVSNCSSLQQLPDNLGHLEGLRMLVIKGTPIRKVPCSIGSLHSLKSLKLNGCCITELPESLGQLSSLRELCLYGCSYLQRLPDALGNLKGLWILDVERTPIRKVPFSIGSLGSLKFLKLSGCNITELPESLGLLSSLENLCLSDCSNLQRLPNTLGNLKRLKNLNFERTDIRKVPSFSLHLHSLMSLKLSYCRIRELPENFDQLSSLELLKVSYCESLQYLPELPDNLEVMSADNCKSLHVLPSDLSIFLEDRAQSCKFSLIDLRNCFELDPNKVSKIIKRVLQNIQIIETKWWEEAEIEGREEFHTLRCGGHIGKICYPGSEIPGWFEFQGTGSSGTLELPQGWLHNKTVGVVICAIVTFADDEFSEMPESDMYELSCDWEVNTKDGQLHLNCSSYWYGGCFDYVDSDHVILRYKLDDDIFPEGFGECCYNNPLFIQFSAYNLFRYADRSKAVKKWGIHFLYRQDFREFMKDRSSDEEENAKEEEEPHPKFISKKMKMCRR